MSGSSESKRQAFAVEMSKILNYGALNLAMGLGYRLGLFDVLDSIPQPATAGQIADQAGLSERYIQEWLGVMVCAGIVELSQANEGMGEFNELPGCTCVPGISKPIPMNHVAGKYQGARQVVGLDIEILLAIMPNTKGEMAMKNDIRERYESRAKIMKALGHPTRLFMVDELSKKDRCVCELTEMIGADISTVSKHLSILREVGIVDYEKQGTQMHYRLATPCVLGFFRCLEDMVRTNLQKQMHCLEDDICGNGLDPKDKPGINHG